MGRVACCRRRIPARPEPPWASLFSPLSGAGRQWGSFRVASPRMLTPQTPGPEISAATVFEMFRASLRRQTGHKGSPEVCRRHKIAIELSNACNQAWRRPRRSSLGRLLMLVIASGQKSSQLSEQGTLTDVDPGIARTSGDELFAPFPKDQYENRRRHPHNLPVSRPSAIQRFLGGRCPGLPLPWDFPSPVSHSSSTRRQSSEKFSLSCAAVFPSRVRLPTHHLSTPFCFSARRFCLRSQSQWPPLAFSPRGWPRPWPRRPPRPPGPGCASRWPTPPSAPSPVRISRPRPGPPATTSG